MVPILPLLCSPGTKIWFYTSNCLQDSKLFAYMDILKFKCLLETFPSNTCVLDENFKFACTTPFLSVLCSSTGHLLGSNKLELCSSCIRKSSKVIPLFCALASTSPQSPYIPLYLPWSHNMNVFNFTNIHITGYFSITWFSIWKQ